MNKIVQITTTVDDQQAAQRIADHLVEARLAACVQLIGPIHSTYRWQGAVESSQEWMCVIKTTDECEAAAQEAIIRMHSYDVPEILVSEVRGGHGPYMDWVRQSTQTP